MQFSYSYWHPFAHLVKSIGTHWENKVTLVKKLNVPINLVYETLKTGDLKNDIPDPAHRSWGGFV